MRKALRAGYLATLSLLGAVVLLIGSAFSAALAFGAIGLIVQGTGTPNANIVNNYLENARNRYLQGTACTNAFNCGTVAEGVPDPTLQGINYPASFFPLSFIPGWCRSGPDGCDKWDVSVGKGAVGLQEQLDYALTQTSDDIVVFGYSQGGAVVSNVLNDYIKAIPVDAQKKRIQIVTIGGIETPDGGLWSRLSPLGFIPYFDITFGPPMTPDPLVKQTVMSFHFDPVGDAPRYFGNPFALLNAVAALETVHGFYLTPNGNGPTETLPYGYTPETLPAAIACNVGVNCRVDSYGNQYVVIQATSLPIADFIYGSVPSGLRPLIKPVLELVAPAYRVLAELGYDYSGDPSVATPLSILPFNPLTFNPVKVGLDLVGAVGQGVNNALGGGTSLSPLNPPEGAVAPNLPLQPVQGNQAAGESPTATTGSARAARSSDSVAETTTSLADVGNPTATLQAKKPLTNVIRQSMQATVGRSGLSVPGDAGQEIGGLRGSGTEDAAVPNGLNTVAGKQSEPATSQPLKAATNDGTPGQAAA
ncbi:PE-PPE domain-containing protein [Mycolicibacterium sediminis]|nr:PE-PPE domain-containing protein [Mycolicibacterium sediminis]